MRVDLEVIFAHSAGVWSAPRVEVVIRVDPAKARFVAEYPLVPGQASVAQPDGAVVVRARVAGMTEAAAWTLFWGRHADVLESAELRAHVAAEVDGADARYRRRHAAPGRIKKVASHKVD